MRVAYTVNPEIAFASLRGNLQQRTRRYIQESPSSILHHRIEKWQTQSKLTIALH